MNWLCQLLSITCTAGTLSGSATAYDGDTISINRQHIRLAGIDAEELSEPNGYAARDHLRALVGDMIVTCHWQGWSYNRRVGTCFVGVLAESDLGASMVRDGFALDCYRYSSGTYRQLEPPGARSRLIQKGYCR
jgi:micrococcal nuclease